MHIWLFLATNFQIHTWKNYASDIDWARLGAQNLLDAPSLSGAHILPCRNKKTLDLQVFSRIGKPIKKFL